MRFENEKGEVVLLNLELQPTTVATLKFGNTLGVKGIQGEVARITIYPGHNELSDIFVYYDAGKVPFMHIQSKYLNPKIYSIYLKLITNQEGYTYQRFLGTVVAEYFIGHLGYSLTDSAAFLD